MHRNQIVVALGLAWWPAAAAAQELPLGIVHGVLVDADLRPPEQNSKLLGSMILRREDGGTFLCGFDGRTYFERERMRVQPAALKAGDRVEAVTERGIAPITVCYVRMLSITGAMQPKFEAYRSRTHMPRATESFAPRGTLTLAGTLAGVVASTEDGSLLVRQRGGARRTIRLRPDTRFLEGGTAGSLSRLSLDDRIFIRGSATYDGHIEAYEIVWGSIPGPRRPESPATSRR
ncbi:MAG: hypothetical protein FJW40_04235 [Acidobacteria bacterium]|nr:hypothetical protein [Acidobacteriota bacterium]